MPTDNAEQIARWNGTLGQRWANRARPMRWSPPSRTVLQHRCGAAGRARHRRLQVAGTLRSPWRGRSGETGQVLGVDVSQPMLAVARQRAAVAGCAKLRFDEDRRVGGAAGGRHRPAVSRFGVMFFADPVAGVQASARGRCACGRFGVRCAGGPPRDNSWAMAPLVAAQGAGITPPPANHWHRAVRLRRRRAHAPRSSPTRASAASDLQRVDAPIRRGATAHEAAEGAVRRPDNAAGARGRPRASTGGDPAGHRARARGPGRERRPSAGVSLGGSSLAGVGLAAWIEVGLAALIRVPALRPGCLGVSLRRASGAACGAASRLAGPAPSAASDEHSAGHRQVLR